MMMMMMMVMVMMMKVVVVTHCGQVIQLKKVRLKTLGCLCPIMESNFLKLYDFLCNRFGIGMPWIGELKQFLQQPSSTPNGGFDIG
jgi:hypothetical protein